MSFLKNLLNTAKNNNQDIELETIKTELDAYRDFYKAVYEYVGTYPNWKVQQEFRQLIATLGTSDNHNSWHFHNLDAYLGKLVDETNKIRKIYYAEDPNPLSEEYLSEARGDEYLEVIKSKHPTFKKN